MAWVQDVLQGVEFVLESIQMVMFIYQEGMKMVYMGMSYAIQDGKFDIAQEMKDTTLWQVTDGLWSFNLMYSMMWMPSWTAFYAYFYAGQVTAWRLEGELDGYKKLWNAGIRPGQKGWKSL